MKISQKQAAWATTGALSNALAPKLTESDLEWVFDLFLRKARRHNRFALIPLFEAFDPSISVPALEAKLKQAANDTASDLRMVRARVRWHASKDGLTKRSRPIEPTSKK